MDKVDARTRETAVTLLDVLWTSNKAAGKATVGSAPLKSNAVNSSTTSSATMASESIGSFSNTIGTNNGVLSIAPSKTIPRHGFDTKGWGNDTMVSIQHASVGTSNTRIEPDNQVETSSLPKKPEHDTPIISKQQQHQTSTLSSASSSPLLVTNTFQNREHLLQRQEAENRVEKQKQPIGRNINLQASDKLQHDTLEGENSDTVTTNTAFSAAISMMIAMKSIGFGIDNSNISRVDATEAAIKAVNDAMERSTLRFHTVHSQSLQIKIQLGVPCVDTEACSLNSSASKLTQRRQPMHVDLARISSVLPRTIPILPVKVEPGGLFVQGETPGAPSICTVVACITLQSESQPPPSKPQSQQDFSPLASVAPPLAPRPPLPLEISTNAGSPNPKQVPAMASLSTVPARMTHTSALREEVQHNEESSMQIQYQSVNALPKSTATILTPPPSSSLLCKRPGNTMTGDQIGHLGKMNPREMVTKFPSSNVSCIVASALSAGKKRQFQQNESTESNQKPSPRVGGQDNNGATKSIEILAMISEQEINRRSALSTDRCSAGTSALSSRVLSSVARNSASSKASTGMLNTDCSNTFQSEQSIVSRIGTSNLKKKPNVHQPPSKKGRQGNELGRGRGGRSASYTDYSNELPLPEERDCWALSTRTTSSPVFPLKLHETLTQIEKDGYDDIIGWLPHGRSFKIHKQKEFTDIILPRYFVMTKKSSFLRQLNLYSFNRFSAGTTDKGSYYHEKFLRGRKFLSRRMTRQKVNGNRIRSAGNPDEEPDLSLYPICRDNDSNSKQHLELSSMSSTSPSVMTISRAAGHNIVSTGGIPLSSSATPS